MGLRVSFTHAETGTTYPDAYVRIHSAYLNTVKIDAYTDEGGTFYPAALERRIVFTFYVYPDEATRRARGGEITTVRLRPNLAQMDLDANLFTQAWAGLKQRAEYASGVDVVD